LGKGAKIVTGDLGPGNAGKHKGVPDRVIVEGENGKIIATGAGSRALLVAMTNPKANLGLVLLELGKASEKIKGILKE